MSTVRLRAAEHADAALLFEWVNRPDSLEGKLRTSGPIPWPAHLEWLAARLADPRTSIWVAEIDGEPIGQVRLQGSGDALDVDIYVVAANRRSGAARRMLVLAAEAARRKWPGLALRALIRPDNFASRRLFLSVGFRSVDETADRSVMLLAPGECPE